MRPFRERFLSNLLAFGATTNAAIYKARWQVEMLAALTAASGVYVGATAHRQHKKNAGKLD